MKVMLGIHEICAVRRDAVGGGQSKAYGYGIVKRQNKNSVLIDVLDDLLNSCGIKNVKPNMVQKLKKRVRDPIARKRARKEAQAIDRAVEATSSPRDARLLTNVKMNEPTVVLDGLACAREITIRGKSTVLAIAWDSVTNCQTGAIVNAANEGCLGGGGIDGRIAFLGGPALAQARLALPTLDGSLYGPRCRTGDAKITVAGSLPCDKVIHAVGPVFDFSPPYDQDLLLLANAYKSAMKLARAEGLLLVDRERDGLLEGELLDLGVSEHHGMEDGRCEHRLLGEHVALLP